ncbi:radical SAM protein [Caulobacter sp. 17J65-9]|uniref:radical SAM protein n=1 Tax=Caulobacter sp. 17J65-9 TaxID=2709382 RepID=UPI0013C9BE07|nr:radical SAM protein [Caulobacter sp. 17J65-9]NEX93375.1 radical SAM protein [Caulobacter sp. 17J65-9]
MIVVWRVLDSCNLSCPFCAYDKRLPLARSQADPAEVARVVDLLGDWRALTGHPVLLSWLGGEPLLWKPLDALTRRARARGLEISTTTNGTTLASARSRAHLLEHYREVTVSIDGFADFHDAMRGWPGAFAKLESGVRQLVAERAAADAGLKVRANVVLMRGNVARFGELCRTLADWGVDEISFNQLGGRDRPEFFPENRLRPADVEALAASLPALRREIAPTRLLGGPAYLERIRETTLDLPLPIADCRVADRFLFIDEQGRIAPCNFAVEHFGLTTADLAAPADLKALAGRLNLAQRACPAPACADCHSTQQFSKFDAAGGP